MTLPSLSLPAARALHLHAQNLLRAPRKVASKADVLAAIHSMAALQIDTISVVARSPYLVLWSRLGQYDPTWLEELLAEGALFEYWSHEACFLPIEDYRLYRQQMLAPQGLGWKYNQTWLNNHAHDVEALHQHILKNGAVRSADFGRKEGKSQGWWGWKPEKRSLEVLFTLGKLMVTRRHNFHRIYDVQERVLPDWDDRRDLISPFDGQQILVLKAVKALGFAKVKWIADYFRLKNIHADLHPDKLVRQGLLLKAQLTDDSQAIYIHPDHASTFELARAGELKASNTRILSPFDPVVWDRKRALELFNFDYRLECYTPEAKRRYGYFCLPILRKQNLIGRMDAKAHRKSGLFEVKALYLEEGVKSSLALIKDLAKVIKEFAEWHGCTEICIQQASGLEANILQNAL